MSERRRRLHACCPGVLYHEDRPHGLPFHYPGEQPDICADCRRVVSTSARKDGMRRRMVIEERIARIRFWRWEIVVRLTEKEMLRHDRRRSAVRAEEWLNTMREGFASMDKDAT